MKRFVLPVLLLASCASSTAKSEDETDAILARACTSTAAGARPLAVKERRLAHSTRFRPRNAELSAEDARRIAKECPLGRPRLDPRFEHGPTQLIARDGYALEHSAIDKVPLWVCERIEAADLEKSAKRHDKFAPDPQLGSAPHATLEDYVGSGYDRGHQAAAADRAADQRQMDETFYLSNMAPQTPTLNEGIWRALETRVRAWVKKKGTLYVITGALFYDEDEEDEAKADGLVELTAIGPGGVAVPTHFYKIVVRTEPALEAIAFVMPNKAYHPPYKLEPYLRSIDWIEERAGIDFMPELDAKTAEQVEAQASPIW